MKLAAALVSALVLVLHLVLIAKSPLFTLFTPRGGIVTAAISMLIANVLVWQSQRDDLSLQTRVQLGGAAWIWIIVQLGCVIYVIHSGV